MFSDIDLNNYSNEEIRTGEALCWVIDEDVVYDANISSLHSIIFLENDYVDDVSLEYPDHDGITVRFYKNGEKVEDFQTSEYFGSVLLSNPTVVNLLNHKNGRHVIAPHAKFINYEFIITNGQSDSNGWYEGKEPANGEIAKCYSKCNCGWSSNV